MKRESQRKEQLFRKRKMLLFVPAVVVPMLVLGFIGLGGGNGVTAASGEDKSGVNMTLPDARNDDKGKPMDKQGYYSKAAADSAKMRERLKDDPYAAYGAPGGVDSGYRSRLVADGGDSLRRLAVVRDRGRYGAPYAAGGAGLLIASDGKTEDKVGEVNRALAKLKEKLAAQQAVARTGGMGAAYGGGLERAGQFGQPNGGETFGNAFNRSNVGVVGQVDPQLAQMGGMLDKLYRIQHPENERDSAVAQVVNGALRVEPEFGGNGLFEDEAADDGFMEIGYEVSADAVRDAAIGAVINGEQTVTAGSTVELRLTNAVTVGGHVLPANQVLTGAATLSGDRLLVMVASIREGQTFIPVSLQVYSLDGLPGIRVQGSMARDVSKASANEAISGLEIASLDPSLSAQAASAGLQFAKSLAGHKVRLVQVTIPSGYRVFLKNTKIVNR